MDIKALHRQMAEYNAWKQQLDERLAHFERWSQTYSLITPEAQRSLRRARHLLQGKNFTLACVGEFSRGKTELINALLHNQSFKRLLPSQPGRTTMCPTEIFWDEQQPANCVRLLPIETRRSPASLQSFKRIPQNWHTIIFDPLDPESVATAIGQVSASKQVTRAEAAKLGFDNQQLAEPDAQGLINIPTWRHALVNLDHPLLREGLRIVDTPGLNALGNEPELTLKTLPEAQAILFLLAADSGVSASDMAIWQNHIQHLREENCTAVLALLNKIDTLWDDLSPIPQVNATIERLRAETARHLQLSTEHVLPLSARQALIGKTLGRSELLLKSRFAQLEQRLSQCILRSQQQVIAHRLVSASYDIIVGTYTALQDRIADNEQALIDLRQAKPADRNTELHKQREKIRNAHHQYHKQALSLRTNQKMLGNQREALLAPVNEHLLQGLIEETYERMNQSWTTLGLSRAIGDFFDDVDASINNLLREAERANKLLLSIYERPEHGLSNSELAIKSQFNITPERRQLRNLARSAESFRRSLNSVFSVKQTLIKRFIATLVKEVQQVFTDLNRAIDNWLAEALVPLVQHNQHQKQLLEHHLMQLGKVQQQQRSYSEQIDVLAAELHTLREAAQALEPLFHEVSTLPAERQPASSAAVVSLQQARQAQLR